MGYSLDCEMVMGTRRVWGHALLETDTVEFRGSDIRTRVQQKDITDVQVEQGILSIAYRNGSLHLDLGEQARRWAQRLQHPPSRLDKLGLKKGDLVQLAGNLPQDFRRELSDLGVEEESIVPAWILYAVDTRYDINHLPPIGSAKGLWVIYPRKTIQEKDVLQAGRSAGLADTKVMRFSETHTALRFVPRKKKQPRA